MRRLLNLALCGCLASEAGAQVAGAIPGDSAAARVLARHIAAIGGEDAVRGIRFLRERFVMTSWREPRGPGTVRLVTMERVAEQGKRVVVRIWVDDRLDVERGYDGTVAWETYAGETRQLDGAAVDELRKLSDIHGELLLAAPDMQYAGAAEFEGRPTVALRFTVTGPGMLREETRHFSPESGLLVGSEQLIQSGDTLRTSLAGYRRFGGVLMPTRITQRTSSDVGTQEVVEVEFEPIADSRFAPPPALRAGNARSKPE